GDIDGDGYGDLLLAAPGRDAGQVSAGATYVLLGGPTGLPASLTDSLAVLTGEAAGDEAGTAAISAGDADLDGLDDVLLGVPYADQGTPNGGAFYLQLATSLLAP
ncbi:MAG: FG-GAP repeat protein, partial [Deltaproteobacteria bacterium]|nr:FG-GAP repeat protein [Deltaproteobacteria bacterium]